MIDTLISWLCTTEGVDALVLSGSRTGLVVDAMSDYDLYVYGEKPLGLEVRREMAALFASSSEVGNSFFDEGDELFLRDGTAVDIMYRSLQWAEEQVSWVWQHHHASVGYSTAFIHNLKSSTILCDHTGRFAQLKKLLDTPYPKELAKAILRKNYPLLRTKLMASYYEQIEHAIIRNDLVSQAHRTAALLASYFDILFAINGQTHPGEKKLVAWARKTCPILPEGLETSIEQVVAHIGQKDLLLYLDSLLNGLDALLKREGWNQ
ncbi:hypothetical protein [Sphaerochaeta sp. PS]|uniref:hypothetical protein n=1 Tax=Sphaerochaeta sp. PS TaxID=3076336 RepID=UPI0028A46DA3|nr:hypothetical protein [Sphaerochaeta sp. PS]MDT4761133.1 hypothetical protein [Sphaerochaeta sp. PS]